MMCFRLQHDAEYGIDKRSGWTVIREGRVVCQLEKWLIVALWKAFVWR